MRAFLVLLAAGMLASAELPTLPAGVWECHGTARLRGQTEAQRFWLRLMPPDRQYGGNRVLQVVYTPPDAAALGGTHLADVPFVLLDEHARVVAWNERSGMSQTAPGAAYRVTRDRTPDDRTDIVTDVRDVSGERGWDLTIAPLLLALTWRTASAAELPLVDLYGDAPASSVSWNGPSVRLAGAELRIEPDARGRAARVVDGQGTHLVAVSTWLKEGE